MEDYILVPVELKEHLDGSRITLDFERIEVGGAGPTKDDEAVAKSKIERDTLRAMKNRNDPYREVIVRA